MPDSLTTTSTFLDGVFLVANGISDLAVVIDSPPCGDYKFRKAGIRQDLFSTLNASGRLSRLHCTGVRSAAMTVGSETAVETAVRDVNRLVNPAAILVTASSSMQLTGEYHHPVALRLTGELGKPVVSFPSASLTGDVLDGFARALLAVVGALPYEPVESRPGTVAIVGMPFERNEMDHVANVRELRRLLGEIDLECVCVAPSGTTFMQLAQLAQAEWILGFPYGAEAAAWVGERLGKPVLVADMPVGLAGTSQWLRHVGQLTGRTVQAEELIETELRTWVPRLRRIVRTMFAAKRVVVAADPYLAQVLVPGLAEIGLLPEHLLVRTRDKGRATACASLLSAAGCTCPVEWDLPIIELQETWSRLNTPEIDLVIGSTLERPAAVGLSAPFLEIGFPSYVRHALFEAPWMGYRGAGWLADIMYNLMSQRRYLS